MSSKGLFSYENVYAIAREWIECNKSELARQHPGKRLLINAGNLTYVVGDSDDDNEKDYVRIYGPSPTGGRSMLTVQL